MLYQLVDFQHLALQPLRLMAEMTRGAFQFQYPWPLTAPPPWSVPWMTMWNPWLSGGIQPMGRAILAGAELVERVTRRFEKPAFGLDDVEETVVDTKPFCRLIRFRRAGDAKRARVLLVAPMSGHHATLLRDTVDGLSREHDVFVTDWTDARMVPPSEGPFGLDDYIDYVADALRIVGPGCHVVAVCQAAVPVMAVVALMATADDEGSRPATMTLMGGPIDPDANPTLPVRLAQSHPIGWFERHVVTTVPPYYPGGGRRVYPGFIQLTGFMSMHMDRHIGEHVALFRHLVDGDGDSAAAHRRFYDEYLSVMDLSADYYLDTIRTVFHQRALVKGTWVVRGRAVDPSAITRTALFTIEGERDDISGIGQTEAAHRLCSALSEDQREHLLAEGVGHFGIFNGRRWRETILPRIAAFITKHGG